MPSARGVSPGTPTHIQQLTAPSTAKRPAEMFTGDVYVDAIARGEGESRIRVNIVRFTPCARTAWHSHSLGQTQHVTEGIGIVAWGDHVTDEAYAAAAKR